MDIIKRIFKDKFAKIYVKNQCDIIPPDKLNRLFEKFMRIDNKTTRSTRGTGLGLFIVKGLIEAMNGEIRLFSNKDYGFCVEITLELAENKEIQA